MTDHKASCKRWKEGKFHYVTSFQIIDRGNYSYSLIETVECEDRKQLEAQERFYIENNECINKIVVGRTGKEWYEDNREQKKAYQRVYDEANKEHRSELARQRYLKKKFLKNI